MKVDCVAYRRWRKITPASHLWLNHISAPSHIQATFYSSREERKQLSGCLSSPQRMEVIQFPSPKVFLQKSPVLQPTSAPVVKKASKPRPAGPTHAKKSSSSPIATAQNPGVTKPKQSKSRNGTYKHSRCVRGSAHWRWLHFPAWPMPPLPLKQASSMC